MFTNTKAQLYVSTFNVDHLHIVHEELISNLHQREWGFYSLWGGMGERFCFLLEKHISKNIVVFVTIYICTI